MAGLFKVLDIGRLGAAAQQTAVNVTGENVTGATTPGYVRRTVVFAELAGQGVTADSVRTFDRMTHRSVVTAEGRLGASDAEANALAQLESIVSAAGGSPMSDAVSAFFGSYQKLAASPGDTTARNDVLAKAQAAADAISGAARSIADQKGELLGQATGAANELNDSLKRIADLNRQIASAHASGDAAADLRDERDKLAREVGAQVGGRAIEDDAGNLTVFGLGTALVDGNTAAQVQVGVDTAGAMTVSVKKSGGTVIDATSSATDGKLGGLRTARDADLPKTATALDAMAYAFATTVNTAHASGYGTDGGTGRDLFTAPTAVSGAAMGLSLDAAMLGHPEKLAASSSAADLPGGNDLALSIGSMGDASSKALAAIAGDVGVLKARVDGDRTVRADALAQAEKMHEQSAGVSVEEEMVNLTKYQRAFEASLKVISTVDQLLDGLLKEL